MSKKKILITWPLPEAAMARARATYDVIAHGDDPKITIDELLATAKTVDALLITLNEKCRKDVIDKMPENIKCISTFSIGFDHIDLDACKARGIKVGNAPHGVTVATAEIAMLLLLGSARRAVRRRAHDPHALVARLAAVAARRPASRRQEARHLRLRQDRPGAGAARPRLRHGNPLLRHLPAASERRRRLGATYHD